MPPTRTNSGVPAKRKPLPFKPPRPKGASAATSSNDKPPTTSKSNAGTNGASKSRTTGSSRRPSIALSSDEDDDEIGDEESQLDDEDVELESMDDTVLSTRAAATSATANATGIDDNAPPPIPQKLLARLLYESFTDKNVKIGKEAMAVFGKYIEIFVREGLARAAYYREEADGGASGAGDGFLQVCIESSVTSSWLTVAVGGRPGEAGTTAHARLLKDLLDRSRARDLPECSLAIASLGSRTRRQDTHVQAIYSHLGLGMTTKRVTEANCCTSPTHTDDSRIR